MDTQDKKCFTCINNNTYFHYNFIYPIVGVEWEWDIKVKMCAWLGKVDI